MKWRSGNRTEDPPKYFKGSSYAFLIKPWLKRFDASQFTVVTLKQYQTRTNATLKFLGSRLGMGMKDTSEMFEHVFANENKNKHDPMKREVLLKLEKYFEPLDEEWKAIVEEGHMGLEDEVEMKLTKHAPAKFMWTHESSSPKTGRKFDQEWALGPGKIYGNGISFIQTGDTGASVKATVEAKAALKAKASAQRALFETLPQGHDFTAMAEKDLVNAEMKVKEVEKQVEAGELSPSAPEVHQAFNHLQIAEQSFQSVLQLTEGAKDATNKMLAAASLDTIKETQKHDLAAIAHKDVSEKQAMLGSLIQQEAEDMELATLQKVQKVQEALDVAQQRLKAVDEVEDVKKAFLSQIV